MPQRKVPDVRAFVAQRDPGQMERLTREREQLAESRILYSDDSGQPALKRSFAVYMDLLGTRERMASLDDRMLRQHLDRADNLTWYLHDDTVQYDTQRLLSFSDNLIMGTPVYEGGPGGEGLGNLLTSINNYQLAMTVEGFFIRGGVAVGPLYMDSRTVTGEALLEAVVLEEEVAVFPRILLSQNCVQLALSDTKAYAPGFSYMNPWTTQLMVDADGEVFVSYLSEVFDYDEDRAAQMRALSDHADSIRVKLNEFRNAGRIRSKYKWVADYHNYFCKTHYEGAPGLLITDQLASLEKLLPRQFRPFAL